MIYRIYPQKDTTIYEDSTRKFQNVGKDEVLEVGKFFDTDDTTLIGNSRILIQFDLSAISQSVASGVISGSVKYYLNLISSDEREIPSEYNLYVYPISQSWDEGLGSLPDRPDLTELIGDFCLVLLCWYRWVELVRLILLHSAQYLDVFVRRFGREHDPYVVRWLYRK